MTTFPTRSTHYHTAMTDRTSLTNPNSRLTSFTEISIATKIPRHTVRRIAQRLNLGTKAGWNIVLTTEDQTKIEEYYARQSQAQAQAAAAA